MVGKVTETEWEYGRKAGEWFLLARWSSHLKKSQRGSAEGQIWQQLFFCGAHMDSAKKQKLNTSSQGTSFNQDLLHHLFTDFHCYGKQARSKTLTVGNLWKLEMLKH